MVLQRVQNGELQIKVRATMEQVSSYAYPSPCPVLTQRRARYCPMRALRYVRYSHTHAAYGAVSSDVIRGTENGCGAPRGKSKLETRRRGIVLRACYAMSGTETGCLHSCYALSGTGIGYGPCLL
eukprot:548155-Rhodomonas_salina.1